MKTFKEFIMETINDRLQTTINELMKELETEKDDKKREEIKSRIEILQNKLSNS